MNSEIFIKLNKSFCIYKNYGKWPQIAQHSQYSDTLQAGQSKDQILVGVRFSTPI